MTSGLDATQSSKLAALLALLDDESPLVRETVSRELLLFGSDITAHIHEQQIPLNLVEWHILRGIFFDIYQNELRSSWNAWVNETDDTDRLESALTMLAQFQNGPQYRPSLSASLDRLSEEYIATTTDVGYDTLARFLFSEKKIRCREEVEDEASTSNLACAIEQQEGGSLTLVCLYILMGQRHGLQISGCNWPGSFYARFYENDQHYVVDCGAGGIVLEADELLRLQGPSREAAEVALTLDINAVTLVRRVLSRLARLYRREGNRDCSLLLIDLLRDLDRSIGCDYHNSTAP